ncbi:hypothetical protein B9T07_25860 [Limnospira fusiformis CCALA 023]
MLSDFAYPSNAFNEPLPEITKSINISGENISQATHELTYTAGLNNTLTIISIVKIQTHLLNLTFTNETADEFLHEIIYYIKHEGEIVKTITTDRNQHRYNIELTCPCEEEEEITITNKNHEEKGYTNIKTIYENKIGPKGQNNNKNEELKTTIKNIANKDIWILQLSKESHENPNIINYMSGYEWNHKNKEGQREMTQYILTQRRTNEGWEKNVTQQETQAIQERSELFNQDFFDRETGLRILKMNIKTSEEIPTPQQLEGMILIYYDKRYGPANSKRGNQPNTWNYATASVPDIGREDALINEIYEAIIQAPEINDIAGPHYTNTPTGIGERLTTKLTDTGKVVAFINLTYKEDEKPLK